MARTALRRLVALTVLRVALAYAHAAGAAIIFPGAKPPATEERKTIPTAYVVQVAARKSRADALQAFTDLQQRYPDILSGHRPLVQPADLGDKGIWHRLQIGPFQAKAAAFELCQRLKAAGLRGCWVRTR